MVLVANQLTIEKPRFFHINELVHLLGKESAESLDHGKRKIVERQDR